MGLLQRREKEEEAERSRQSRQRDELTDRKHGKTYRASDARVYPQGIHSSLQGTSKAYLQATVSCAVQKLRRYTAKGPGANACSNRRRH